MEDRNQELFRQYNIKIYNTYRIRGAFILETDKGLKLLKSLESSKNRVEFEYSILDHLANLDYPNIDLYVRNQNNEIITEDSGGNKYVLKNWFPGEECNLRDEADVADAASNLAYLHSLLREVPLTEDQITYNTTSDLKEVFDKRNRELRRVRSYIRDKRKKNEFELCYLNSYDEFFTQAQEATDLLKGSNYKSLIQEAIDNRHVCHGNYTYHNIIMLKSNQYNHSGWKNYNKSEILTAAEIKNQLNPNMATANFDKAYLGVQVMDLYHFMRKVMEKNDWDLNLGSTILDTYTSVMPITMDERKFLYVLLLYPEKFWKITNFYYNGKKSWVPQRNIQKLIGIQEQTNRKKQFMDCLAETLK